MEGMQHGVSDILVAKSMKNLIQKYARGNAIFPAYILI
jgi:hypothetical protein